MKKISIIVPIYKSEKYLDRCIESIVNQTYKNLEIILVDDGSPDNCPKICDEYAKKDSRIVVVHKENGGVSSARNAGLDIAKGDYIAFVDSDDYIEKDMYLELLNGIKEKNSDIAVCNYVEINNNVRVRQNCKYNASYIEKENILPLFLMGNVLTAHLWNKLYKKELFGDIRFKKYNMVEDLDIMYLILEKCNKIRYINKEYYNYFYDGEITLTRRYNVSMINDFRNVINNMYKHFEFNEELNKYLDYNKVMSICRLYVIIAKANIKDLRDFENEYLVFNKSLKNLKKYNKVLYNQFSKKEKFKINLLSFNKLVFVKMIYKITKK